MSFPVAKDSKNKRVVAIPKDNLIKYYVLKSAFKTHENLSQMIYRDIQN
jgi:hypothetical protein